MLRVNPNRMELMKLRRRLIIARRGHKLLKDKLDEMMKYFLQLLSELGTLREDIEKKLEVTYQNFSFIWSKAPTGVLENLIGAYPGKMEVAEKRKTVFNISMPEYEIKELEEPKLPFLSTTNLFLERSIREFASLIPELIELASRERALFLLGEEIERTKRRVNALENTVIPQLEEQIKFISFKLDEMDRESRTRLLKVKKMLEEAALG